eukprot:scaffold60592_cov40-Prasinocladus_malaysianus.AAC.1
MGLSYATADTCDGHMYQVNCKSNAKANICENNGEGTYRLARMPPEDLPVVLLTNAYMAIELDIIADLWPLNLPSIAKVEPVVRLLVLEAILDGLKAGYEEHKKRLKIRASVVHQQNQGLSE